MAKDTEKLIRQLSLISYLMAERRPVTALEIRRDVEGYSGMNEDAFARRFYADRSELESLRIQLTVDRPADGAAEQENYSLRPENFHLPAIEFSDEELAALQAALHLLDGEFAYAEPLRLALQQITWGRPSPLRAPEQRSAALGITASAGGHELSIRLAKIETAIFRNKTITFEYYTMARDETGSRRVDPYHLLFQGGEFYLLGYAHEREQIRVFRLSRIRGKVSYATKAEHDFRRPADFDPREYAGRAEWQLGDEQGTAEVLLSERIAWQIERHFGRFGEMCPPRGRDTTRATGYCAPAIRVPGCSSPGCSGLARTHACSAHPRSSRNSRGAWRCWRSATARARSWPTASRRSRSRRSEPDSLRRFALSCGARGPPGCGGRARSPSRSGDSPGALCAARDAGEHPDPRGRRSERVKIAELCESLQLSDEELREDINVLNVVNFGGGSYVLYAEILEEEGEIDVDPEPYSDNFDRPARLLPVEAKALVAAIDLVGEHIPEGSLSSAREKIVAALGEDPMEQGLQVAHATSDDSEVARIVSRAIVEHRLLELDYYKAERGRVLPAPR